MTNEEANKEAIKGIERNICNHMDLCRWVDCEKCAVGLAIKAIEKADKYRWHDLRKNPDDLPKAVGGGYESEYVLVMIGTPEWHYCEWAYYHHAKKVWSTHEQQDGFAWRYIEPFEENKDDE